MQEEKRFTKLSALVDSEFTIEKVQGFKYKMWDQQEGRMKAEDNWFQGSRKMYQVETDAGLLDLSESQLGQIFAKVQHAGTSTVVGVTVAVKSNGKTGIDIRYYLNPQKTRPAEDMDAGLDDEQFSGW